MASKSKQKKSNGKKIAIAVVLGLLVVLAIAVPFAVESQKAKAKGQQSYYESWLPDNCNCLEKNRNTCLNQSFIPEGNYCVNKNLSLFTNVIKSCSEYECSGVIYSFDMDRKMWEEKQ